MEPSPPTGLLTLVFTDIESSSDLWQEFGAGFQPVLDEHNRLMREAAQRRNGYEVKTVGDAFFLVFPQASEAVRFALEAQLAFHACAWSAILEGLPELRVRMGLHTGEPILSQHPGAAVDYFGPAVNRAARVGGAGHGGQVILSETTRALAAADLPPEVTFIDRGSHRLKGVGEEHLWQLAHPVLRTDFPPLATLDPDRHNLPGAVSPYVGRERELTQWLETLREPGTRLVSLLGFGGMGKTRTALHLAELMIDDFRHGVWWVALDEARDAEGALQRIALALRLALQKDRSVRDQLLNHLKERSLLLVLDNVEQIEGAARIVTDLLEAAPGVKVLVTTRRALEVRQERRIELQPLGGGEAEGLFVESARARSADFALTADNRQDVVELCRRLEGVPLAIELAASRIVGMTPREMLERLSQQFRLLQTRAPDLPPRQRALRGAIDWSYDLLSEEDRKVFAQLAVFAGGFDMEAAEAVCDSFDAFEAVMELRKHSLLRAETDPTTQQTRFTMLLSVRTYAEEKLTELPDAGAAFRRRHAEFYLQFVEKWLRDGPTRQESAALRTELENLYTALSWWEAHGPEDLCARLAAGLYTPLYRLGLWTQARQVLDTGLEAVLKLGAPADGLRAELETSIAALLDDLGELDEAAGHIATALEIRQRLGDAPALGDSLNIAGLIAQHRDDLQEAERCFREALDLLPGGDAPRRARLLHNLAYLATRRGELLSALTGFEAALEERRGAGDSRGEAETVMMLGAIHHMLGSEGDDKAQRYTRAGELYSTALAAFRTAADRYWEAAVLHNLGELEHDRGNSAAAVPYFAAAERILVELQSKLADDSSGWLRRLESELGPAAFAEALETSV